MPEAIETISTSNRALLAGSMVAPLIEIPEAAAARRSPTNVSGSPNWTIYEIACRRSGRAYVGLTRRPLAVRLAGHDLLARRRPHLGRPGSLLAAIRRAHDRGLRSMEPSHYALC